MSVFVPVVYVLCMILQRETIEANMLSVYLLWVIGHHLLPWWGFKETPSFDPIGFE